MPQKIHSCKPQNPTLKPKFAIEYFFPSQEKNFKIFLALFKEKIKTLQRTTDPGKKDRNESIDSLI